MGTKAMWGRMAGVSMAFVVFLGACGVRVDYLPLNSPPREMHARLPAEVEFFEGVEPSQPYVEVATIDGKRRSSHITKEEIFAQIRVVAAGHGCDGVKVIGRMTVDDHLAYRAACIVYRPSAVASESELATSVPAHPANADEAKAAAPGTTKTTTPKSE
ncbi:hypothetical protein LVJ94_41550 [Pendulispora rubella]|uniref:Lipoprotein n=1 Tax=Pendulispora rubella TaxID=2741070 RepID=A0ABZ2KXQ0_9BACT